jgi:hypothetical protein
MDDKTAKTRKRIIKYRERLSRGIRPSRHLGEYDSDFQEIVQMVTSNTKMNRWLSKYVQKEPWVSYTQGRSYLGDDLNSTEIFMNIHNYPVVDNLIVQLVEDSDEEK